MSNTIAPTNNSLLNGVPPVGQIEYLQQYYGLPGFYNTPGLGPAINSKTIKRKVLTIEVAGGEGGKDRIYLDPLANTKPVAILGINGSTIQLISAGGGYSLTAANNDDLFLLEMADGTLTFDSLNELQYENGPNLQLPLTAVGSYIDITTGTYTEVRVLYMDNPAISWYRNIYFRTKAGQATYDDTALRGMTPAFVIYNNTLLDIEAGEAIFNGSQITIAPGPPIIDAAQLIIVPQNLVTCISVPGINGGAGINGGGTVSGQMSYTLPFTGCSSPAYVIVGSAIVSPLNYTIVGNNGAGNSTITFKNMAINGGKRIVICSQNFTTMSFSIVNGQPSYSDASLQGMFFGFVFYGSVPLTSSQYSLSGYTITLNGIPLTAVGNNLVIVKA